MKHENKLLLPLWIIVIFLWFVWLYIWKSILVTLIFTGILLFIFTGLYSFFYTYFKSQIVSYVLSGWIFLLFFWVIWFIISSQIDTFSDDISRVWDGFSSLTGQYSFLSNYLQDFDIKSILSKIDFAGIGKWALSLISGIIWGLSTVWILLIFLMLEKHSFAKKFKKIFGKKSEGKLTQIYRKIYNDMNLFFLSKFSLALLNATVSWIIMFFFGLEYALMFALLVFLLDFIPAVGGIIALSLPFLYSFTVFDSSLTPFILLACMFIPQFISWNVLEPKIMGNRLNLSSFMILIALVFWSSMWWLVGAFLAVPLMAMINIVCARFETTKWVSILLSKNGKV